MYATSYNVALDAYVEMCPPTFVFEFARTTIAIAFQRRMLLIFASIRQSPGYGGCSATGIVLIYGVETARGTAIPARRSRSNKCCTSCPATSGPRCLSSTSSISAAESSNCRCPADATLAADSTGILAASAAAFFVTIPMSFNVPKFPLPTTARPAARRRKAAIVKGATAATRENLPPIFVPSW